MIRALEHKLKTAQDSRQWLATLDPDSGMQPLIDVLDVAIESFETGIAQRAITEPAYYRAKLASIEAAELLSELCDEYAARD